MVPHNLNCNKGYRSRVNWLYVKHSGETKVLASDIVSSKNLLELTCNSEWRGRKTNEFNEEEPGNVGKQGVLTSAKNIALGMHWGSKQHKLLIFHMFTRGYVSKLHKSSVKKKVYRISTLYASCFGNWQSSAEGDKDGRKKKLLGALFLSWRISGARCLSRARSILNDGSHPGHKLTDLKAVSALAPSDSQTKTFENSPMCNILDTHCNTLAYYF